MSLPLLAAASLVLGSGFSRGAWAAPADQVATVTHLIGKAQIFTHPSSKPHGGKKASEGSIALYEGEYYRVRDARVGDRVAQGNLLRTAPDARARVIYSNGDQIVVGPGSAYRVLWDEKTGANPKVDVVYGQIRGVVEKGGPRGKFTLRTKTATMGVRGTDFFISEGLSGETEVSVIRGSVEVMPNVPGAQAIEVKTGNTATIPQPAGTASPLPSRVELRQTTQEDFQILQKSTELRPEPAQPGSPFKGAAGADPTVQRVKALEAKAVQVTLKDIQTYQPDLHRKLSSQADALQSVDELQTRAVQELSREAPKAPERRKKVRSSELERLEAEDAYRKYFKTQD